MADSPLRTKLGVSDAGRVEPISSPSVTGSLFDGASFPAEHGPALAPLDAEGVLWVAAIELIPIESRIEWVKTMLGRVEEINRARASYVIPAGDARCAFTMDACVCMKRKGHDGLHACAHGGWRGEAPGA